MIDPRLLAALDAAPRPDPLILGIIADWVEEREGAEAAEPWRWCFETGRWPTRIWQRRGVYGWSSFTPWESCISHNLPLKLWSASFFNRRDKRYGPDGAFLKVAAGWHHLRGQGIHPLSGLTGERAVG